MQKIKQALPLILALGLGLGAGYLLFRNDSGAAEDHQHEASQSKAGSETTYTCSMHPQVRQPAPGRCPICEMELIPLEETRSDNPLRLEMSKEAVKLADIQTTTVGAAPADGGEVLRLNGKIRADERRTFSQVAHIPGRIEKLHVSFTGERVRQGQPLATIYSPPLITAQQELLEARSLGDNLLEAARRKLRYWKIPEATIRDIEASGEIKETITVFAEASGVVKERRVASGDYVQEGEILFDITNLNKLWVLFDAYEEDLPKVDVGDRVVFSSPTAPGETFATRIAYIDPMLDEEKRVAALRGEVRNVRGLLKPGVLVRGRIATETAQEERLVLPRTAVLWTGKRSVVYLKVPGRSAPSFEYREVRLGKTVKEGYLVEAGLEAGDQVVTHGAFTIDAAAQLNNQRSMINRHVEVPGQSQQPAAARFRENTPQAFRRQLDESLQQYLTVKDALVATDSLAARQAAGSFLQSLERVDGLLLEEAAFQYWEEHSEKLRSHARRLAEAERVAAQRERFDTLSQLMIQALEAFGPAHKGIFVQHCPMAFDNTGADWLAQEAEIRNPYFGDQMLTCGTVRRELDGRE